MMATTHPDASVWRGISQQAIERAGVRTDNRSVHSDAFIAAAIGLLHGWQDDDVTFLLGRVTDRRNPDGGYGLDSEFDAFGNGSVNPPETSYIVTMADHVGLPLLAAHDGGRDVGLELRGLAQLIMSAPPADDTDTSVSYSLHPNDTGAGYVANVNAGAAAFVAAVQARGIDVSDADEFVQRLCERVSREYIPEERAWPYSSLGPRRNDPNHAAYLAEAMLFLDPGVGHPAALSVMETEDDRFWDGALGRLRLLPFLPEHGPELVEDVREHLMNPRRDRRLLARLAFFAARMAAALESEEPGTVPATYAPDAHELAATPDGPAQPAEPELEDGRTPRVLMLVGNDVTPDTRVKKVAASVARAGLDVVVVGITNETHRYETRMAGVSIVRLPLPGVYRRLWPEIQDPQVRHLRRELEEKQADYEREAALYWLQKREYSAAVGRLQRDTAGAAHELRQEYIERRQRINERAAGAVADRKTELTARVHRIKASSSFTPVRAARLRSSKSVAALRIRRERRLLQRRRERAQAQYEQARGQARDAYRRELQRLQSDYLDSRTRLARLRSEFERIREEVAEATPTPAASEAPGSTPLPDVAWRDVLPTLHDIERVVGPEIDRLRPDVIHGHDMHMVGIAERAAARARRSGRTIQVIYDAHEYVRGLQKHMDPERLAGYIDLEAEYLPRVDRVITVSPPLADLLQRDHGLTVRPDVVLNAPILTEYVEGSQAGPTLRERIGLPDAVPLLVYSGRVHASRGVTTLVRALAHLPGVHLALVGEPPTSYRAELLSEARALELGDRVHILGYVAADQVVDHVRSATAGVNLLLPIPNHALALPNKFFEYLHADLPLVNADVGVTAEIVKERGFGEVFDPEDPESLARAAGRVLEDAAPYRAAIREHRELIEQYSWEAQERVLVAAYREMLGSDHVGVPAGALTSLAEHQVDLLGMASGVRRVAIGVTNMAGQAWEWMKAVEHLYPAVATHVATIARSSGALQFETDVRITKDEWRSLHWQTRQVEAMTRGLTHALLEGGGGLFGTLGGNRFRADAAILSAHGVEVGLVFHGSDIRDPNRHRELEPHSPFDPADQLTRTLQQKVDVTLPDVLRFDGPVFVSTNDLLDYVSDAEWLPVVVDLDLWTPHRAPLHDAGPLRVVHLATNNQLKGSDSTLAVARRLAREGLIELIEPERVPPSELPAILSEVDVFIDGTRLGDYGVTACQALALNCLVVGNVGDRVRRRIPQDVPIVQADPMSMEDVLRAVAKDRDAFREQAASGRDYVRRFHDGTHSAGVLGRFLGMEPE